MIISNPLRTVYLAAGTGYVPNEEWGHGHYKGPLVVEGRSYDMSTQAKRSQYAFMMTSSRRDYDQATETARPRCHRRR